MKKAGANGERRTAPLFDPDRWLGKAVEIETKESVKRRGRLSMASYDVIEVDGEIPHVVPDDVYLDGDPIDPIPIRQIVGWRALLI